MKFSLIYRNIFLYRTNVDFTEREEAKRAKLDLKKIPKDEYKHLIKDLSGQMEFAAANLEFEKAAELRDIINDIKAKL